MKWLAPTSGRINGGLKDPKPFMSDRLSSGRIQIDWFFHVTMDTSFNDFEFVITGIRKSHRNHQRDHMLPLQLNIDDWAMVVKCQLPASLRYGHESKKHKVWRQVTLYGPAHHMDFTLVCPHINFWKSPSTQLKRKEAEHSWRLYSDESHTIAHKCATRWSLAT
jgi:hypothetical protein